jgi:hypothetical protein
LVYYKLNESTRSDIAKAKKQQETAPDEIARMGQA